MKTPTCQPRTEAGFTLIEMLVVLTILGLVAGLGARSMSRGPDRFSREQAGLKLELAIRKAAADARVSGSEVSFNAGAVLPGAATAEAGLLVYPDGSTSGGIISLGGRPLLSVHWLTGEISRAE